MRLMASLQLPVPCSMRLASSWGRLGPSWKYLEPSVICPRGGVGGGDGGERDKRGGDRSSFV